MLADMVAAASNALNGSSELICDAGQRPRYDLFHAANSICSQKVRCVLAYHQIPYISHPLNLFRGETYLPDYVRLRMIGCVDAGNLLVAHHSGSTSATQGCDGVVVPTLIDRDQGKVIVDSKRISILIDHHMPDEVRLRPDALADVIDKELAAVDHLPNYQILMGHLAEQAGSEAARAEMLGQFSQRKVGWCDTYLAEVAGETDLVRAYSAKRAKELSAAQTLFSEEAMTEAYAKFDCALNSLEMSLHGSRSRYLFGDEITMADLFWGIELIRLQDAGVGNRWASGQLPNVRDFVSDLSHRRFIREAILDWPGALYGAPGSVRANAPLLKQPPIARGHASPT